MGNYIIQTLMGCIGSVGFAVLFNVRENKLLLIAASSALSWAAYLLCAHNGAGVFWGLFCATIVAAFISEILARVIKAPVLMLLVPILIPLIPGGDLYHMMSYLVRSQHDAFLTTARLVLVEAGAIALGIIFVASAMNVFSALRRRFCKA